LKRTFLALELPDVVREEFSQLISDFSNFTTDQVKWVEDQNLHITIQFIGDTRDDHISKISQICSGLFSRIKKPELFLPSLEIIPGNFPRIIWIEFKTDCREIFKISREIRSRLRDLGYKLDKKPLKLHTTLGRVKKRLPEALVKKILTTRIENSSIILPGASFYHSILRPQGPIYNLITSYQF